MRFRQILAARGVHYLVTRWGPAWLRSLAFDEKYLRGDWIFREDDGTGELGMVVRRYLRKGDLLVMGCGGASILEGLEAEGLNSALGIDLSEEAIRLAHRYASGQVTFHRADMVGFACPQSYDVILFSESLYYVPSAAQKPFLTRLAGHLKPGGVLIVTFVQAKRYKVILERIRKNFAVLDDHPFAQSKRHLIVFHSAPAMH